VFDEIAGYIQCATIGTMSDVIRVMKYIDESVPKKNGFGSFNWLYLTVTEAVKKYIEEDTHLSDEWLPNLDVAFAKLYFDAIVLHSKENPLHVPRAWATIFDAHRDRRIQPVQFAIAGLFTHIIVDLPVAVAQVSGDPEVFKGGSDEHKDFLRINPILNEVEIRAVRALSDGLLREISRRIQPYDRYLVMPLIAFARDRAWEHAKEIASYPKKIRDPRSRELIHTLDRETESWINTLILKPAWLPI
jgi:hypothetical protein